MTATNPCNFGERFIASKGQPLQHDGKTVVMLDRFPCKLYEELVVTIESTDSDHPQGVGVSQGVEIFGDLAEARRLWTQARDLYSGMGIDHMAKKMQDLIDALDDRESKPPPAAAGETE